MITIAILLVALGLLGWGFYRARPYGTPGILAWLQSVALMLPWLVVFGLSAAGIFLNLVTIILLLVVSSGAYIILGNRLRAAANQAAQNAPKSEALQPEFKSEFKSGFESEFKSDLKSDLSSKPLLVDQPESKQAESKQTVERHEDVAHRRKHEDESQTSLPNTAATEEPSANQLADSSNDASKPSLSEKGPSTQSATDSTMPAEDLELVQGIFSIDTFFMTETVPYQNGAIFKGNLRGDAGTVHACLTERLAERMGDRYRLYIIEGTEGKPVIVVLPKTNDPKPSTPLQWGFAGVLAIATIVTCLETAGILQGFDVFQNPGRIQDTLLVGGGLLAVLAVHDIGHWLKARYHHIRLSPPFFMPAWQIGSFGSIIRFESVLPNRNVLFDIAAAGPIFGGVLSLGFLVLGLLLSHQGSLFQIPTDFFQGSILVGTLARVVLGNQLQQPLVDVHPLTLVGWLGLVITALNLMPAGQLDGGRIVQSIYGRNVARRTTVATLIVLGIVSFINPLALYWAILILFLQRDLEQPSLDELTEPDDTRAALGLLVLFLMAATLLPLTPGLAGRLGIGG